MPVRMSLWTALWIALCAVLGAVPSAAQSVQVEAQVDAYTLGDGERLTYSLRIQGAALESIRTPEPPPTSNLVLMDATPATEQYATQNGTADGTTTRVVTFSWRYRPMRLGTATLDPVTVRIGSQTISTSPIEVQVVPQSQRSSAPPTGHSSRSRSGAAGVTRRAPDASESLISEDDLFIDVSPTDTAAFVGEQVPIEYRLYFRPGIRLRQSRLAEAWEAPGFWREELEVNGQPRPNDPDATYRYIVIKRVATFPTRPGPLQVRPLRVETEATPGLGMAPTSQLMPMRRAFEDMMLASPTVQVDVAPLPTSTAPPSFEGAVGQFEWTRSTVPREVSRGEGLSFTVSVAGTGNLYAVEAPAINVPDYVDVLGPEEETTFDRSGTRLQGTRTFTYTLVPRRADPFTVPALSWSHFDPTTESFVTHDARAVSVRVQPRPNDRAAAASDTSAPSPPASSVSAPSSGRAWGGWMLMLGGVLGLGVLGAWTYWRWATVRTALATLVPLLRRQSTEERLPNQVQGEAEADAQPRASRRSSNVSPVQQGSPEAKGTAMKHAQMHLDRAQHALRDGTTEAFYHALERAVVTLIAQRLGRSPHGRARHELLDALKAHGIALTVRETADELLRACDQAQFSPATPSYDSQLAALDAAHTLILHLDAALHPAPPSKAR